MGSGEEFPPVKGPCLLKAHLPLVVNLSQKVMREVLPVTLPQGTLKHFPGTKNTALKKYKTSNICPQGGGMALRTQVNKGTELLNVVYYNDREFEHE